MKPFIRLVRATGNRWIEYRFFDLIPVRVIMDQLAIDLDMLYLAQQDTAYPTFPGVGSVLDCPYQYLI